MTKYYYKGFEITQPHEDQLVIKKGEKIAKYPVAAKRDEKSIREFIDEFADELFITDRVFEHEGWALIQSGLNNHYMIFDDKDRMRMH